MNEYDEFDTIEDEFDDIEDEYYEDIIDDLESRELKEYSAKSTNENDIELKPDNVESETINDIDITSYDDYVISELKSWAESLNLSEGEVRIPQIAGIYEELKGINEGIQMHHIPAKSVVEENEMKLPTIGLLEEDHRLTDSYGGRQRHISPTFLGDKSDQKRYKDEVKDMMEQGDTLSVIKNEILEIREKFDEKYDGAISSFVSEYIKYIKENGVPKVKNDSNK